MDKHRNYFMQTARVLFAHWTQADEPLAQALWSAPQVTRYICASGVFTPEEVKERLNREINGQETRGAQYWPIFLAEDEGFLGCCGLRQWVDDPTEWELGFHLLPAHWGKGLAQEAAAQAIDYGFNTLGAKRIYAGHHPQNAASAKVLQRLGLTYLRDSYYEPTGLHHPVYYKEK